MLTVARALPAWLPRGAVRALSFPAHEIIRMPALSPTMESGTLVKWVAQEGSEMGPGDVIAEVQTDKAAVDFESTDEGYLAKILVPEGTEDILCGTAIAVSVEDEGDVAAFSAFTAADVPGDAPTPEQAPAPAPVAAPAPAPVAAPAPAPVAAPAPAPAPAATPAPAVAVTGSTADYTPWAHWGGSVQSSPMYSGGVQAKLSAYHTAFGDTLTGPVEKE